MSRIPYRERYVVNGREYGIEDLQQKCGPGESHWDIGPKKRFMCWTGGCGIGHFSRIEEARALIQRYATQTESENYARHRREMRAADRALKAMVDEGLKAFYVRKRRK